MKKVTKMYIGIVCLFFLMTFLNNIKYNIFTHKENPSTKTEKMLIRYSKVAEIKIIQFPYDICDPLSTTDYIGEPIISGEELYFYFFNMKSKAGARGGVIAKYDMLTGEIISWSDVIQSNNVIWDDHSYAYSDRTEIYVRDFKSNAEKIIFVKGERIILEKLWENKIIYTSFIDNNKEYHIYDLQKETDITLDLQDDAFLSAFDNNKAYFAYSVIGKGITVVDATTGVFENYSIILPSDNIINPKLHTNNRGSVIINGKLYATLVADNYDSTQNFRQLVCFNEKNNLFEAELLDYNSKENIQMRTFFEVYSYNNRCLFEMSHTNNDNSSNFSLCELNGDTGEINEVEIIDYTAESNFCLYENLLVTYDLEIDKGEYVIYLKIYDIE